MAHASTGRQQASECTCTTTIDAAAGCVRPSRPIPALLTTAWIRILDSPPGLPGVRCRGAPLGNGVDLPARQSHRGNTGVAGSTGAAGASGDAGRGAGSRTGAGVLVGLRGMGDWIGFGGKLVEQEL